MLQDFMQIRIYARSVQPRVHYETFNAASKAFISRVKMFILVQQRMAINASLVAMEFDSLLPAAERPERTEDHEGHHLISVNYQAMRI